MVVRAMDMRSQVALGTDMVRMESFEHHIQVALMSARLQIRRQRSNIQDHIIVNFEVKVRFKDIRQLAE